MLKRIRLIIIAVTVSFAGIMPISKVNAETAQDISIKYQGHVQNIGWQTGYAQDGQVAGTSGRSLRVEALKIELASQILGVKVLVKTHVQNKGWSDWLGSDAANKLEIGTTGSGLRMEAFQIKLEGAPAGYHIAYQAHVQNIGWQEWVEDGAISGSTGKALRIEALKIKIVKGPDSDLINPSNGNKVEVEYSPHIQNIGWEAPFRNGELAGTIGQALRLEALNINLVNPIAGMKIKSQAHVQNRGWLPMVDGGTAMGTSGLGLRIEALKLTLEGAPAGYHIQYQAYVQNIGWQNWFEDGAEAGTDGKSLRIEALRIRISNKALPNIEETTNNSLQITYSSFLDNQLNQTRLVKAYENIDRNTVDTFANPQNLLSQVKKFQFLRIDTFRELQSVEQLNDRLKGMGLLEGRGQVFVDIARELNIDPIYLVSHAIWETGRGTSTLSKGVAVGGNVVYNFFGIGATDDAAIANGSATACVNKWFSPELAIRGGAQWISSNYVNHSTYKQNTLYKIKWNSSVIWHEYASDPNWANGISSFMNGFSDLYKGAKLTFETPVYKAQ